jgi:hypothetical protein
MGVSVDWVRGNTQLRCHVSGMAMTDIQCQLIRHRIFEFSNLPFRLLALQPFQESVSRSMLYSLATDANQRFAVSDTSNHNALRDGLLLPLHSRGMTG